jgi:membrane glycosyltransferase
MSTTTIPSKNNNNKNNSSSGSNNNNSSTNDATTTSTRIVSSSSSITNMIITFLSQYGLFRTADQAIAQLTKYSDGDGDENNINNMVFLVTGAYSGIGMYVVVVVFCLHGMKKNGIQICLFVFFACLFVVVVAYTVSKLWFYFFFIAI